jgi:hypothetical protein
MDAWYCNESKSSGARRKGRPASPTRIIARNKEGAKSHVVGITCPAFIWSIPPMKLHRILYFFNMVQPISIASGSGSPCSSCS